MSCLQAENQSPLELKLESSKYSIKSMVRKMSTQSSLDFNRVLEIKLDFCSNGDNPRKDYLVPTTC